MSLSEVEVLAEIVDVQLGDRVCLVVFANVSRTITGRNLDDLVQSDLVDILILLIDLSNRPVGLPFRGVNSPELDGLPIISVLGVQNRSRVKRSSVLSKISVQFPEVWIVDLLISGHEIVLLSNGE